MKVYTEGVRKILVLLLFLMTSASGLKAQESLDSIEASLLTCSPGTEVYSLYGHTALRIQNVTRHEDWVFNYGVFSFHAPHFVWRFTLGQTDYELDVLPYDIFVKEYQDRGSSVVQQKLNLSQLEANRLMALLAINYRPENRTYRYNFLTNNCTTKARDIVEQAIDGQVCYAHVDTALTYRQIMHQYTTRSAWAQLGNDVLLGADCDTVLSDRASMFIPRQLLNYFDHATIRNLDGTSRDLVSNKQTLVKEGKQVDEPGFPLGPGMVCSLFMFVCMLIFGLEYRGHRIFWWFDVLLMSLQGVAGCLLCFMFFFSEHPTMDSNWQIWILNPLPLFFIPWVVRCARQRQRCLYHNVNAAVLGLFLLTYTLVSQNYCVIMAPLALSLLTRPISYYLYYKKEQK